MKKIFALLLALVMILTVSAGCKNPTETENGGEAQVSADIYDISKHGNVILNM